MLGTGGVLGKRQLLPPHYVDGDQPAGEARRGFHRIGQTAPHVRANHQPVHHHLDGVFFILLHRDGFGQVVDIAVHPHPDISGFPGRLEFLGVLTLASPDHRRQHLNPGSLLERHHPVDDLIHRLLLDFPAADGAMRDADPGIEQAEIVVDFGDGPHGGTGIFRGGLLVDGNGGRQTFDIIHVRLFHLAQKLAGIGGQAFHVPPLSLGVDGIEGQGGFSRSRQAGKHHQLVPGDFDIHVFQIVFPGALDGQFALHKYSPSLSPAARVCRHSWIHPPMKRRICFSSACGFRRSTCSRIRAYASPGDIRRDSPHTSSGKNASGVQTRETGQP